MVPENAGAGERSSRVKSFPAEPAGRSTRCQTLASGAVSRLLDGLAALKTSWPSSRILRSCMEARILSADWSGKSGGRGREARYRVCGGRFSSRGRDASRMTRSPVSTVQPSFRSRSSPDPRLRFSDGSRKIMATRVTRIARKTAHTILFDG